MRIRAAWLAIPLAVGSVSGFSQTLRVVPSQTDPPVGSVLQVEVRVEGLAGPPHLGAFDIFLNVDSAALAFQGVEFGGFLGDAAANPPEAVNGFATIAPGQTNFFAVALLPPADLAARQPGSFPLLTALFAVVSEGDAVIDVAPASDLSDAGGDPIQPPGGVGLTSARITARSPVGIPLLSAWSLLWLAALLAGSGVFLMRRI